MTWALRATFLVRNLRAVIRELARLWADLGMFAKVGIPVSSVITVVGIIATFVT